MNARIISIGNELILGQTVDTNAAWLAQQLARRGIRCDQHVTVPDDRAATRRAIEAAATDVDIVLVTGGLGPTPDDLTRAGLADALGVALNLHEPSLKQIERYFEQRRRRMHETNRLQAMIPVGAEAIENTCGTAPGVAARVGWAMVYCMPGVPSEMEAMFERSVLPALLQESHADDEGEVILQRTLRTFGMSESEMGQRLSDLMRPGRNPAVGTSAAELIISIRVNAHAERTEQARSLVERDLAEIRRRLGDVVFGEGDDTLEIAVARLLMERGLTIAAAESCTGGLIAKRLTDVPGSSAYFLCGVTTYANASKRQWLDVPAETIETHGAVSRAVAEAMADGCRRLSDSDIALSTTGIAGPTGGSADKPVGLVYVALATRARTLVRELRLGENLSRAQVRDRTVKAALNLVRRQLPGA